MIVFICQHCDEQQFRNTVICSCVPYTIFSKVKLDLCIRTLLLDHILALKKMRVRLACILLIAKFCLGGRMLRKPTSSILTR